jgi:ABC-type branched-subunit amino acid transport system ATPase component
MRIKSIEASNFKSLVDFRIELAQFNCLIGLNGSGKSTVLQFIDFVSQLVRGDMKGWLNERKWKSADLKSKLTKKTNIDLCVAFADKDDQATGRWEASYSPSKNRCTRERIDLFDSILEVTKENIHIAAGPLPHLQDWKDWRSQITFGYEGSILSALKEELLPPPILECKKLMMGVKSLDLLSPEYLRQRTRESAGSLGLGGQKLAAFLHELGTSRCRQLAKRLKDVYPQLENLHIRSTRYGWKQLEISEEYQGQEPGFFARMTTEARHINDGMLRLIAILAELQSDHRFLLFDEIENGINPELVEFVIEALTLTDKQVLVTTHSPMILNYLSDQVAKSGVIYLYKAPTGSTKAIRFFSIPSLGEKLTVMGPGEAFVDTNLTELTEEIQSVTTEAQ